jgi:choloylglycine hydrolase
MKKHYLATLCFGFLLVSNPEVNACTGISLKSKDNGVVVARTVEWALSDDRHNRIMIMPRNNSFQALTPKGANGKKWTGTYGFVSLTAYGENFGPDGMNEKGLYVGLYYLPGFTSYAAYEPDKAAQSMSVGDLMQWMLSSCSTVKQVKDSLDKLIVVQVDNKSFGGADLPFHFKIADPTGASLVIEFVNKGEMKLYEPILGVITNSPTYDWHLTNLRNYLQLSTEPHKPINLGNLSLAPLGAGSGLMGLPGDYTPPSRFIRAMALTASARPLATSSDAVMESFRILDNFNIPLGAHVTARRIPGDIVSATQITTACDLKEKVFYFHTMWNRMIRKIELGSIDFSGSTILYIEDDVDKMNNISNITPVVPLNEADELDASSEDTMPGVKCKTHAGYIWSKAKNRCIRTFEDGSPFSEYNKMTGSANSKKVAFIVLSDDRNIAEVFFPDQEGLSFVLYKQSVSDVDIMPVIYENSLERLQIRHYRDYYHLLHRDEIRFVQGFTIENGLFYKLLPQ